MMRANRQRQRNHTARKPAAGRRITVASHGSVAVIVIDSRPVFDQLSWILISPLDTPWAHGNGQSRHECVRRALAARDRIDALDQAEAAEIEHQGVFEWDEPADGWILTSYLTVADPRPEDGDG
jgi:hypothetical protein